MNGNIEIDACVVQRNYKMAMIEVHSQLRRCDIESLKFLCSDFIPVSKIERIQSGLHIVQALQQKCLVSQPDNILFLAELLFLIGRIDLLQKLHVTEDDVKSSLSNCHISHVSSYR